MERKTILMLLNQRFLPDIRVEQEYRALKDAGYRVIVVADENGKDSADFEIIRVRPNEGMSWKYNLTLRTNPKLKNEIVNKIHNLGVTRVDIIHVHDLFWSFLGIELKRYYQAKLVIDLHENYPGMIRDFGWQYRKWNLKAYLVILFLTLKSRKTNAIWDAICEWAHGPDRLEKYEKRVLKKCDGFIVVVDEALERYKNEAFYNKGIVVSNTKDPGTWKYDKLHMIEDKLILTYMGSVQDLRGLDTAILAMKYLDQSKYQLNIIGLTPQSKIKKDFENLLVDHSISNVNLIDWLDDENKAFEYINNAHVCIVTHKNTELTQTTVPHKLFMYMAIGRPVLVSDVAPLKRIVEEAKCGLVFKADNPENFAARLSEMRDQDLLSKFSKNGREAAERKYNWSEDSKRLVAMYASLGDN